VAIVLLRRAAVAIPDVARVLPPASLSYVSSLSSMGVQIGIFDKFYRIKIMQSSALFTHHEVLLRLYACSIYAIIVPDVPKQKQAGSPSRRKTGEQCQ
jgi:hypothetical protein